MEIDLSFVAATLSMTILLIFGWYSYKAEPVIVIPDISRFPFNESTGKERSFVNKTSDTSKAIDSDTCDHDLSPFSRTDELMT